jgi:hypothetical protein
MDLPPAAICMINDIYTNAYEAECAVIPMAPADAGFTWRLEALTTDPAAYKRCEAVCGN